MNGKQLKNSILQWAIQGKLVPQDPNDEPASVLLERIRAEKARLVKEGKIKKDKNESIIFRGDDNSHYEKFPDGRVVCIDDEIPFQVPQSWEWIRLGSIVDFSKSGSVKSSVISDDAWILDLEDIEKDTGKLLQKKRMRDLKSKSDKHSFSKGDVLYSKLRPYLNKVIIADEAGYCTTEILSFDFGYIFNRYAQLYLMSPFFVDYAMSDAYGVKMPRLGSKQGNAALMPIPPKSEQIRIVKEVDAIMPLVARYGKSQKQLDDINSEIKDRLRKSVLQEAIQGKLVSQVPSDEPANTLLERIRVEKQKLLKAGKLKKKDIVDSVIFKCDDNKYYEIIGCKTLEISDEIPFDLPESWSWCRLASIAHYRIGKTPARGETAYWEPGTIPWVSISDMKAYGTVDHTKESVSPKATSLLGQKSPMGTLLMSFKLTVGRTAVLDIDAYHNEAIISIWPFAAQEALKGFLFYTLPVLANLGDSKDAIKGKTLNTNSINNLLIPLPPENEQFRIVKRIKELYVRL